MSASKRAKKSPAVASVGKMIRRHTRLAAMGDQYATPWDDLPREWGRGHGPIWSLRKAFRREKLLGTW